MTIRSTISLDKDAIIGQSNEAIQHEIAEHFAQDLARQIVKFVRTEMVSQESGPTMADPFGMKIEFRIEAELSESGNRKRIRERDRMRTMMSTPTSVGDSPSHDMHARERSERMRGVYTPNVYNGDPLAKPATVQRIEDDQRAAAMESAYRTHFGESAESAFRQQYMLAIDPATEDGNKPVQTSRDPLTGEIRISRGE